MTVSTDRRNVVAKMAEALRSLPPEMLDSGTARWGAYERARLVNFADRQRFDPERINANVEGIVHNALDREAARVARVAQVARF